MFYSIFLKTLWLLQVVFVRKIEKLCPSLIFTNKFAVFFLHPFLYVSSQVFHFFLQRNSWTTVSENFTSDNNETSILFTNRLLLKIMLLGQSEPLLLYAYVVFGGIISGFSIEDKGKFSVINPVVLQ